MNEQRRILIVDDNTRMRVALCALLSQEPDFEVVGEPRTERNIAQLISTLSPHVVLMDLTMPGTGSLKAIAKIKRSNPRVKVLVFAMYKADEYVHASVEESLKAGTDGFILKDSIHEELCDAIRSVLKGKTYVSPAIALQRRRALPLRPISTDDIKYA